MGDCLKRSYHLIIIHSLRTDNADGSAHSFSQFISGGHHTAVLHCLDRRFIADINLDSCAALIGKSSLYQLRQHPALFKGIDDFTCPLMICQLRILENVIGSAGVYFQILFGLNGLCNGVYHITYNRAVYPGLLLHSRNHTEINLLQGQPV